MDYYNVHLLILLNLYILLMNVLILIMVSILRFLYLIYLYYILYFLEMLIVLLFLLPNLLLYSLLKDVFFYYHLYPEVIDNELIFLCIN